MFTQCRYPFTNLYKRKIIFIRGDREGQDGKTKNVEEGEEKEQDCFNVLQINKKSMHINCQIWH